VGRDRDVVWVAVDPAGIERLDGGRAQLADDREEAPDDFGKPETDFNICSFWRLDALARIGRRDEARAIFEAMLAARTPLGLLSEDTHPATGEMWLRSVQQDPSNFLAIKFGMQLQREEKPR
jgi:hypothetical protein